MGKSKKFISKESAQHYVLMHRSQTDEAHAKEGNPSEFVLVRTDKVNFIISYLTSY